jgi:hypothetical protein
MSNPHHSWKNYQANRGLCSVFRGNSLSLSLSLFFLFFLLSSFSSSLFLDKVQAQAVGNQQLKQQQKKKKK